MPRRCCRRVAGSASEAALGANPRVRGRVPDDPFHLRAMAMVFIDGVRSRGQLHLDDPLQWG